MIGRGCSFLLFVVVILAIFNDVESSFDSLKKVNRANSKFNQIGNSLKNMFQHGNSNTQQEQPQEHGKVSKHGGKGSKEGKKGKNGHKGDKHNEQKKSKADKQADASGSSEVSDNANAVNQVADPVVNDDVESMVGATCTMQVTGYLDASCAFGGTKYTYTTGPDSCYQGAQGNWAKYECYEATSNTQSIWVYTSAAQADCQSQTTQSNFIEYKLNVCTKNSAVTGYYSKVSFDYAACCGSVNSGILQIIPAN